jgi:RNA polymerase sigma-70 factor (ECF subfamily)
MTQLTEADLQGQLEAYRAELTGYCYRMLGSAFEAEDAVQEAMLRAWRGLDRFDGRAALRSWLYRIATNVCLDMLNGRNRRALPMDMSPTASPPVESSLGEPLPESAWLGPAPDASVLPGAGDPAEVAVSRESVRLAFIAALQNLPPKQRAVLILRDVLRWHADEAAELLGTSVASVNSALQRARATMSAKSSTPAGTLEQQSAVHAPDPMNTDDRELVDRYVEAFERYDMQSLVALLHEDATMSMPPYALWLQGPADIAAWMTGPGCACEGSRLVPVAANGSTGFGQYKPNPETGRHEPWSLITLEVAGGRITGITHFLDTSVFKLFGLPEYLDEG